MKIIEKILDVQTGEENVIEREETAAEKEFRLKLESERAIREAERLQIEEAREAIFNRLGITAEEAKLLLS